MSGLVKAKKYDWKDSNLALFGSDTEKEVKKAAAEKEPAWKKAGKKPGLQIWRINKFKVESWPTDDYGNFYSGDSYIILNTYKDEESDKLLYDVHFWIGKESTQDEYGTAAYKTVELDTLLDDVPVQHREVQGYESPLFKSYFSSITYLDGGAATGFRHVKPEEYRPRLLKISTDTKPLQARQVKVCRTQITSDDVYLLDDGTCFYQFNGKSASVQEKYTAVQVLAQLKSARPKSLVETVDENEGGEALEAFYEALKRADDAVDDDDDDDDSVQQQTTNNNRMPQKLIRLSDASGDLDFKQVKEGGITRKDFISNDVFLLDTNQELFVWVGKKASEKEKANGLTYAHKYLQRTTHPFISVTCMKEGQETRPFSSAIAA
ncbi:gelsolin-like protein 1 isoform X2 [Babylonia areolata]|uniref:gelsolin-like protein 1 isoform X2 n=1 Tax=Babylonia areolata TaxID=304850 RepID=UPI003FD0EB65